MKRLAVVVAVLATVALAADRAGAAVAGAAIAAQAQTAAGLPAEPEVSVGGFPFLTQALAGRYTRVEVQARGVPAGELTVDRLDTTLHGVRVTLGQALSGDVQSVPVERVEARALLSYAQLSQRSGLSVAPAGAGQVRVSGEVEVLGRTVTASAVSSVALAGDAVVVTAERVEAAGATAAIGDALRGRLDFEVPVRGLPYDLEVTGVTVEQDGVWVEAGATDIVLSPG